MRWITGLNWFACGWSTYASMVAFSGGMIGWGITMVLLAILNGIFGFRKI